MTVRSDILHLNSVHGFLTSFTDSDYIKEFLMSSDLPYGIADYSIFSYLEFKKVRINSKLEYERIQKAVHMGFSDSFISAIQLFVDSYDSFLVVTDPIYEKPKYWEKIPLLKEWHDLQKAAKGLIPHFESYMDELNIGYTKGTV